MICIDDQNLFCDTNQGLLIKGQQTIDGKMIVRQDQLAYEIKMAAGQLILRCRSSGMAISMSVKSQAKFYSRLLPGHR